MKYLHSKLEKGWQEYENALVSIYCSCTYISKCRDTAFYGKGQENCHCIGGFRNNSFYSRLPVAKVGIMGKYEKAKHFKQINFIKVIVKKSIHQKEGTWFTGSLLFDWAKYSMK